MVTRVAPKKLTRLSGDIADIRNRIEKQSEEIAYLREHYAELLREHRNQWIVISGGKLVMATSDPRALLRQLGKSETRNSLLYYLADPDDCLIL